mgnify:CR=1 FL=1
MIRKFFEYSIVAGAGVLGTLNVPTQLWERPLFWERPSVVKNQMVHTEQDTIDIGTIAFASTVCIAAYLYGGIGFADIAYATRRNVQQLKQQLLAAQNAIVRRVDELEEWTRKSTEQLDSRICEQSKGIRSDIGDIQSGQHALTETTNDICEKVKGIADIQSGQHSLTNTANDIREKVQHIETMAVQTNQGINLLCSESRERYGLRYGMINIAKLASLTYPNKKASI